ncbi:MAG: MFS transporter [Anaerolineae bacterium]|nr:MFS transporter [Anaerolineae bacterium]
MNTLKAYIYNVKCFSSQARLYLFVSMLNGIGMGIFQLFFNFYILSLGYEEDFLGILISIPSLTGLLVALFSGYVSDLIGRKRAFILGGLITVIGQGCMLAFPTTGALIVSSALRGLGQSLFNITASPFLMEHSTERERTHLFSFNAGISTVSSFLGNFIGGGLPLYFGNWLSVGAQTSKAYAWSLGSATILSTLILIPLAFLNVKKRKIAQSPLEPFKVLWQSRRQMFQLLFPSLVLSLGAGLLMPFMNVFFRHRYHLSDHAIGTLFGFGSLGMGIAILLAPVLAEKWGKAKTVVATQGLSIPFLIVLGFIPNLWLAKVSFLIRSALMNLSGPVYQTMIMEEAEEDARGMAASLYNMIWSTGWALSPSISGPVQKAYGFNPVFIMTITMYGLSIALIYVWFVRKRPTPVLQREIQSS